MFSPRGVREDVQKIMKEFGMNFEPKRVRDLCLLTKENQGVREDCCARER